MLFAYGFVIGSNFLDVIVLVNTPKKEFTRKIKHFSNLEPVQTYVDMSLVTLPGVDHLSISYLIHFIGRVTNS